VIKVDVSNEDLQKLFWLAARDFVFFSTHNPETEEWDNQVCPGKTGTGDACTSF